MPKLYVVLIAVLVGCCSCCRGAETPTTTEALALARPGTWEKVALTTSDGVLRGLLQVDAGRLRFKRSSGGKEEDLAAGNITAVEYTDASDPYAKQAKRCLDQGDHANALATLAKAPPDLAKAPHLGLLRLRARAAQAAEEALRAPLLAPPDAGYAARLEAWAASGRKELDPDLTAAAQAAWHALAEPLGAEGRTRFLAAAKAVRLSGLRFDEQAPAHLVAARQAWKSGDAPTAAKSFQLAWDGHAAFTDDDRVAMAGCLLAAGRKAPAAELLRALPPALRERDDVLDLLTAAGIPRYSGTCSFRGDGTGVFADCEPPTAWGGSSGVLWSTAMPDRSNGSPCLAGNVVFTCAEPQRLLCVSAKDGSILWERVNSFADVTGQKDRDGSYPKTDWMEFYGYTTPTPCSNGKVVVASYGIGLVVAYDLQGRRLWHQEFTAHSKLAGLSASPLMLGDRVYLPLRKDGCQCRDATTGTVQWTAGDPGGDSSLCPMVLGKQVLLLTGKGGVLDAASGREVFSDLVGGGGGPSNWGPTPVAGDGLAFFHWHFKDASMNNTAIRAWHMQGPQAGTMAWAFLPSKDGNIRQRMGRSPLYLDGLLYAIDDSGRLQVLEGATGTLVYQQDGLGGSYASLTSAGGLIYHIAKGDCVIFKPGRTWQQVARFKHGFDAHIGSPVFAGRRMYYRCKQKLWCVGG